MKNLGQSIDKFKNGAAVPASPKWGGAKLMVGSGNALLFLGSALLKKMKMVASVFN